MIINKEKLTDLFNALIEINNDRIECYVMATKMSEGVELKNLFAQLIQTSQKCKTELIGEICDLGGTPIERTIISGKFFRTWMDVISSFKNDDYSMILNSLGNWGSGFAIDAYNEILNHPIDDISDIQIAMLNAQHESIRADYNKVMQLQHFCVGSN